MPYTSNEIRTLVVQKKREGHSTRQIGNMLNISRMAVSRIMARYNENGDVSINKNRGHPRRLLSIRTERALARVVMVTPQATARTIQHIVGGPASNVSLSTIKRSLRRAGCKTYRPVKAPSLTPLRMRKRLQWCLQHQFMTVDEWKKVFIVIDCIGCIVKNLFLLHIRLFSQMSHHLTYEIRDLTTYAVYLTAILQ